MAICPVANSVGCEKCKVVKICVLRSVLGNYGADHMDEGGRVTPGRLQDVGGRSAPGASSRTVTEEKPNQSFSEAETIDVESKPPEK